MTQSTIPLATASVDDSDVDEPFSPDKKTADEQTRDGLGSSIRLNYADEFGIGPASPTRQYLRAGHSTTMEKLQNKASARSQSTTLEDVAFRQALRKDLRPSSTNGIEGEQSTFELPLVSFLSRDGDALAQSSISMSSPDFAISRDILAGRELSFPDGSAAPTELLSDDQNPLHLLVHGQLPDGLPSTKPSSGDPTTNLSATQPSIGGTQDDLAAAAQIGDDLLANMLNDHVDTMNVFDTLQQTDGSQDELAQPLPGTAKARGSTSNSKSRKRMRIASIEDGEMSKTKRNRLEETTDDDIFAGMPVEHYKPRMSRSRATATNNDSSLCTKAIDIPETQKGGKTKSSRRQPVDNVISPLSNVITILEDDEDEKTGDEAQQAPASARHGSEGKEHGRNAETITQVSETDGGSQKHERPQDGKDTIIVGAKQSQKDIVTPVVKDKTLKKSKQRGKKGSQKQEMDEGNHPQTNEQAADDDKSDVVQLALQRDAKKVADTEVHNDDEDKKESARDGLQSPSDQPAPLDNAAAATIPVGLTEKKEEQSSEIKKPKGKTKARGRPKKSTVEVVTLPSSSTASPIKTTAEEDITVEAQQVMETPMLAEQKDSLHVSEEAPAQVLSDKTNTTAAEKPATPEKPGTTSKHSSIGRVNYRVGLSRRSRIEPLLKIVRKEKDSSKEAISKKKA